MLWKFWFCRVQPTQANNKGAASFREAAQLSENQTGERDFPETLTLIFVFRFFVVGQLILHPLDLLFHAVEH
jgi:hypothetical protein